MKTGKGFPGGPVVRFCLVMQGLWVGSLGGQLRSHKPYDQKHKTETCWNKAIKTKKGSQKKQSLKMRKNHNPKETIMTRWHLFLRNSVYWQTMVLVVYILHFQLILCCDSQVLRSWSKRLFRFPIASYRRTQMNFWANQVFWWLYNISLCGSTIMYILQC